MQQIDVLVLSLALSLAAAAVGCGGGSNGRALPDGPPSDDAAVAPDAAMIDAPDPCHVAPVETRVKITLDTRNAEWVTSLTWIDSSGATTPNLASSGAVRSCSGPNEQFGQLYGAPEGNPPFLVGGNTLATSTPCSADLEITSAPLSCDPVPVAQTPVTTEYHFYGGAQASQVRITRTIGFDASTPVYPGIGIRPYVPRVPLPKLPIVIYPDATASMIHSTGTCGGDCFIPVGTTWNGRWLADIDPSSGLAMIVLRDPGLTSPVDFTVNNDDNSSSNLSSFVLLQPTGGWTAPVTEIEYLCFADLTSWPQAQRDAATLPAGCGP